MHPVIISASRSTDIPAFYTDWFIKHLNEGSVQWQNPFNNKIYDVFFDKTRLIVFWTKNPLPILKNIHYFNEKNIARGGCLSGSIDSQFCIPRNIVDRLRLFDNLLHIAGRVVKNRQQRSTNRYSSTAAIEKKT